MVDAGSPTDVGMRISGFIGNNARPGFTPQHGQCPVRMTDDNARTAARQEADRGLGLRPHAASRELSFCEVSARLGERQPVQFAPLRGLQLARPSFFQLERELE